MPQTGPLDYKNAYRYAAAWAAFDHDNVSTLRQEPQAFEGRLGSLYFQYSEQEGVLHSWGFVMPGAGPFLAKRREIKTTLDRIAQQQPSETAGGVFDIRTLPWNDHDDPRFEPGLYLRADIVENGVPLDQMVKRLDDLSTAAYVWNQSKMERVLDAYWQQHARK